MTVRQGTRFPVNRKGVPLWNGRAVNTVCAYRSWGLDIDEMENALRKLRKLGL